MKTSVDERFEAYMKNIMDKILDQRHDVASNTFHALQRKQENDDVQWKREK